jgi:hypothetical protein
MPSTSRETTSLPIREVVVYALTFHSAGGYTNALFIGIGQTDGRDTLHK